MFTELFLPLERLISTVLIVNIKHCTEITATGSWGKRLDSSNTAHYMFLSPVCQHPMTQIGTGSMQASVLFWLFWPTILCSVTSTGRPREHRWLDVTGLWWMCEQEDQTSKWSMLWRSTMPTLPTRQLECRQFSQKFGFAMLLAANEERDAEVW